MIACHRISRIVLGPVKKAIVRSRSSGVSFRTRSTASRWTRSYAGARASMARGALDVRRLRADREVAALDPVAHVRVTLRKVPRQLTERASSGVRTEVVYCVGGRAFKSVPCLPPRDPTTSETSRARSWPWALLIQPFGNAAVTTTMRTRRCGLTCITEPLVTGVLVRWDPLRISWRADADILMISRQNSAADGRPRKKHTMPARTPDEIGAFSGRTCTTATSMPS